MTSTKKTKPVVIIMGSQTDLKVMKMAAQPLEKFKIPFEIKIISAHRTPVEMVDFASKASQKYSDLILGFHPTILPVYLAFFVVTIVARVFLQKKSIVFMTFMAGLAGLWFWLVSNFGVWALMDMYPKSLAGLSECFVSAIPFLETQVLGDLFFTAIMFSLYALILRFSAASSKTGAKTYSSI